MKSILTFLALWALFYFALALLTPKDDSDGTGLLDRSGMSIYHDALTGCEYLGRLFVGVAPRLDANGKQICRK